jgi:alpha-methylacyl-CoA racemase
MGPLAGYKIIELAGIGPVPMCCMMLSDMGAEVLTIDRIAHENRTSPLPPEFMLINRGRRSLSIDLKKKEGVEVVFRIIEQADALVEGFRPGVAERLGVGPDTCLARNPKLIYGRMTGWGQEGPLAHAPGHDINYISLTGVLHAIGRAGEPPVVPLNVIGDFGGGALFLAFGILCGLLEATRSGCGQVIDASIVDGTALLSTFIHGFVAAGLWSNQRGENILDGGAHFYGVYETADGKYISIGSVEPQFYAEFLRLTGLEVEEMPQMERVRWPEMREQLKKIFKTKTREEWCTVLEGTDACFTPVLSIEEAWNHPHNQARGTFVKIDGITQPAPAPRFSRTSPQVKSPPSRPGQHTDQALTNLGFSAQEIARLRQKGVVA